MTRQAEQTDIPAIVTKYQFEALRLRLDKRKLIDEVRTFLSSRRLQRSRNYDHQYTATRLRNGWNTEKLLQLTSELLTGEDLVCALQWAFPQAYYSVYAVTLAFFNTVGYPEKHHTSVIKKMGALIFEGKYPACISFTASGPPQAISFAGINEPTYQEVLRFDPRNPDSVDSQIAHFLKGTRKRDLVERRLEMKIKKKDGTMKKKLSVDDWEYISDREGLTSVLSLLYRKRIKANYRDIDCLLDHITDAQNVFICLSHIVSCLNFIHESFMCAALGRNEFNSIVRDVGIEDHQQVMRRLRWLEE